MKQMNRVKQVLGIALAALMALATFTGCGAAASDASSKGEGQDLLAQIKAKGKIVVGMNAEFAPYEFHAIVDGKDTVSGFDVELAKALPATWASSWKSRRWSLRGSSAPSTPGSATC